MRDVRHPRTCRRAAGAFATEVAGFLGGRDVLDGYESEVRDSGLMDHLLEKGREHHEAVGAAGPLARRDRLHRGGLSLRVLREVRPEGRRRDGRRERVLDRVLAARAAGERRRAPPLDRPARARSAATTKPGTFYEGEGRAGIPPGSEPGWLIPTQLKERWTLILGRSQEELPPLLERLGTIDSFMHDSEHSFDCMWFEFNAAWPALRPGGVLLSDDVNSTEAFARFAAQEGRQPVRLARGMALLRK